MREWLWRALASAGAGCGGGAYWAPVPIGPESILSPTEQPQIANSRAAADNFRRYRRRGQRDVVRECEAFVTGRYYEVLLERHQLIPAWALVNPLAHSDRCEVERIASLSIPRHKALAALPYMAREVLLHTPPDNASLEHIQDSTLIPLELELLGETASCDPRKLAKRVRDDLNALVSQERMIEFKVIHHPLLSTHSR
jgi:hypothetical protein